MASGFVVGVQLIPFAELWEPFGKSLSFGDSWFMVLTGYMDESEDDELFSLGALFSTGIRWTWFEVDWKYCMERWNKRLVAEGRTPISRFHATDCWTRNKEFKGWSISERDQLFSELRSIIDSMDGAHSMVVTLRLSHLKNIFGIKSGKKAKRIAYQVLLYYLMMQFGTDVTSHKGYRPSTFPLIHDRTTNDNEAISRMFWKLKDDQGFPFRSLYTTIVPFSWEDCIALQAADLIVYESRKQISEQNRRIPESGGMKKLLELESFGGHSSLFTEASLSELKIMMETMGFYLQKVETTPYLIP